MTTVDFITALFYEVDEQMRAIPKHPEARLWPSENEAALSGNGDLSTERTIASGHSILCGTETQRCVPFASGVYESMAIFLPYEVQLSRSQRQ